MKLYLETVPFNSARLPRWLEQHLVGDHLGELIEELLAVRRPTEVLNFDAWFLPWKEQILSTGLAEVPRAVLRQLMADPPALRKLQKEVLLGGGRYWDQVPRSKGFRRRMVETRPSFAPTPARTPPPVSRPARSTPVDDTPIPLTAAPPRRGFPVWAVVAAVVATVAVSGVVVWAVLAMSAPPG